MQLRYVKTYFRGTIHVFPVFSSQKGQRCAIHVKSITPKGYVAKNPNHAVQTTKDVLFTYGNITTRKKSPHPVLPMGYTPKFARRPKAEDTLVFVKKLFLIKTLRL